MPKFLTHPMIATMILVIAGSVTSEPLFDAAVNYPVGARPQAVFSADFNGDGDEDLAVTNYGLGNIGILMNNGSGTFAPSADYYIGESTHSVFSEDFDRDGDLDLAVSHYNSSSCLGAIAVLMNNGDGSFAPPVDYAAGGCPQSVFSADFDDNGYPDLAAANAGSDEVSILINNGDGTFAAPVNYPVGDYTVFVISADFDGDGCFDLAVVGFGTSDVSVMMGNCDGTFGVPVSYSVGALPTSVFAADFDNDGDDDLAVTEGGPDNVSVLWNNGDGTFGSTDTYPVGAGPRSVVAADFDGNGFADLAVFNQNVDNMSLLLNDGDGSFSLAFTLPVGDQPFFCSSADFDNNGFPDLAVPNAGSNTVSIMLNNSVGSFANCMTPPVSYAVGNNPAAIAAADLDGSGASDLVVGCLSGSVSLLWNSGSGGYPSSSALGAGSWTHSVYVADVNGDGSKDVVAANQFSNTISVFLGDGLGMFATQVQYSTEAGPVTVAGGDLDGDGDIDLVTANITSNSVSVLYNDGGGTFPIQYSYQISGGPISVLIACLDSDATLDIAVGTQSSDQISVLLNTGDGTFAPPSAFLAGYYCASICVVDADSDGDWDIAAVNTGDDSVAVLENDGNGFFGNRTTYAVGDHPTGVVVGDFDSDGLGDIAIANYHSNNVMILTNEGDGSFARPEAFDINVGIGCTSICAGDLDGDGRIDLAVTNDGYGSLDSISILFNCGEGNPTPDTGSVTGVVAAAGVGLLGVPVDLYDSDDGIMASAVTDEDGQYEFAGLDNGEYSVSVSTPIGYQADEEIKSIEVRGLTHEVNFYLTELEIAPRQRSRGYWAHQLLKALQYKPKDYTIGDFAGFAGLINIHFNQNRINPVDFYGVPQPADETDSLDVLKTLLHMGNVGNEDQPSLKRLARAQLMALMLNVVSGNVGQTHVISADDRTVSQAVTYCDMLVKDEIDPPDDSGPGHGSPWRRYIRANFILGFANLDITVPAGMIEVLSRVVDWLFERFLLVSV